MKILVLGVSGSGKDRIIVELQKTNPDLVKLSSTRILMQALGFKIDDHTTLTPDLYLRLENTSEFEKQKAFDTNFQNIVAKLPNDKDYILTGHLVVPARINGKIKYQTDFIKCWYNDVFDKVVYIKCESEVLFERYEKDKKDGVRDRGDFTLEDVIRTNEIGLEEWESLKKVIDSNKLFEIDNSDSIEDSVKALVVGLNI